MLLINCVGGLTLPTTIIILLLFIICKVSKHYAGIPRLAVEKYTQLCPGCHGNSPVETPVIVKETKPEKTNYFMKRGQVRLTECLYCTVVGYDPRWV